MPVVHVRAIEPGPGAIRAMLDALPSAVEAASGIPAADTWVTFTPVAPGAMSVGDRIVEGSEGGIAFADIHLRERDLEMTAALLEAAARCIAAQLRLPVEDVWVRAWPLRAGEVFAGGGVLRW